ncbi:amidohydrolase/deacetylase family metallohydrolase [Sinomicrobium weinanense]|uniref:Amidohydrolase/deacetylase family metallohydrolase n=1 Tax=Sinomicrobium weinanense TaxID=2842200 RepID=A0A926JVJ8_9FLAO|nr:amidohydrolase/deacetylase family metallohydrolase [Sinomicrobium weinanense]MBC9797988.1 amidohydrolase/deacetylase family metallohydrolase [Sinomicrobium weinanense]MBU3125495.1 amidohydrolase/deacetylase family metallohydrolase [Sinomicrobium weinanense]
MKVHDLKYTLIVLTTLFCLKFAEGQEYDLLIRNGTLVDAKSGVNKKMDVAISGGKIAEIANSISVQKAKKVIDARDKLVTPGLIDIHGHVFFGTDENGMYSGGMHSVAPDNFTFRSGVTTIVDAGSSGWRNFHVFKKNVIDNSKTRVLAFLNIVGSGMKGGAIEQNINDMDPKLTAMTVKRFPELVGVKLAHYSGFEWEPTDRAMVAGTMADVPVMIDFGGSTPALSIKTLFLEKLRPGDIFTHAYASLGSRERVVNDQGKVKPFVFEAQKKGIVFDVGHGGGSFAFSQAIPAMQQGFKPNSISTDLHIGSMNGGMKDMLNIMSKFINMDMPLGEVMAAATWNPAQYIKRPDLGHLSVGAIADVAILSLKKGDFGFVDTEDKQMKGNQKLECEVTIKDGEVVYDLNGLSSEKWDE